MIRYAWNIFLSLFSFPLSLSAPSWAGNRAQPRRCPTPLIFKVTFPTEGKDPAPCRVFACKGNTMQQINTALASPSSCTGNLFCGFHAAQSTWKIAVWAFHMGCYYFPGYRKQIVGRTPCSVACAILFFNFF